MSERTNRREAIISAAADLFQKQGYTATTIRQIAEVVGVTEAALYYHFKEGKRELLGAVLESHMPNLVEALSGSEKTTNLHEMLTHFGRKLGSKANRDQMGRFRWLAAEYSNLSEEERSLAHERMIFAQQKICQSIQRFITDEDGNRSSRVVDDGHGVRIRPDVHHARAGRRRGLSAGNPGHYDGRSAGV